MCTSLRDDSPSTVDFDENIVTANISMILENDYTSSLSNIFFRIITAYE